MNPHLPPRPRADADALTAWNAANKRARDEYATHPHAVSSCRRGCTCPKRRAERRTA